MKVMEARIPQLSKQMRTNGMNLAREFFPPSVNIHGARMFRRHEVEIYKRRVWGEAITPEELAPPAVMTFLPLVQFAKELGVTPRTLHRWAAITDGRMEG